MIIVSSWFLFQEQYKYLHKVALVGYYTASTIINVKDMHFRLADLESDEEDSKSSRNYKQEFDVSPRKYMKCPWFAMDWNVWYFVSPPSASTPSFKYGCSIVALGLSLA